MLATRNKLQRSEDLLTAIEESDEERELTNLNWLMHNQNLTLPKTIDANSESDINAQENNKDIIECQKSEKQLGYGSAKGADNKFIFRNSGLCSKSKKTATTTTTATKRPSPTERYNIFISKIKRDLLEYNKSASKYTTDVTEKPPFNYSHIIGMAMLENGRVTLQQICAWIESKFAFFRVRKKWNNSIRHNLSLHHCFRNRKREEKGKGGYWELGVDPKKCDRKRIRNRKTTQSLKDKTKIIIKAAREEFTDNTGNSANNNDSNDTPHICIPVYQRLPGTDIIESDQDSPGILFSLTKQEVGLGLTIPYATENNFLTTNSEECSLSQQFERGTIIVRTKEITDDSNCIVNKKIACSNMIYAENDLITTIDNANISPLLPNRIVLDKEANIALVTTPVVSGPEFTINCDYSNYRPYVIDESFNYLYSTEWNRNDDNLDNLLDVCVRDF